jgi:putative flavoprotein involved in K+ transport
MELYGQLEALEGDTLRFRPSLGASLDSADRTYNGINAAIDKYIDEQDIEAGEPSVYEPVWAPQAERETLSLAESGIGSVVWCIGFAPDFRWLDAPVFNGQGHPVHERGLTQVPGLYFIGLPWLHTWGSGRFSGVAADAAFVAEAIGLQREALHPRRGQMAQQQRAAEASPA